jgi:hypothetical protein
MEIQKNENEDIMQLIKEKLEQKIIENKINESENNIDIFQNKSIDEVKIKNLKIQFNMFKIFLYSKLKKREYKTVLNQIEGNFSIYHQLHESEELLFLKIETLIKIINNKIIKYSKSKNENTKENFRLKINNILTFSKSSTKILKDIYKRNSICNSKLYQLKLANSNIAVSIEKYYSKIIKEFNILIEEIPNVYQNEQVLYIEKIIQLFLKLILVKSSHHEKLNQIPYVNYYLSLGEKLIFNFNNYIKSVYTLNLCQEIFLCIAKQFFINHDIKKVEKYCIKCIDYCFRELIFKFGNVNIINYPKIKFEKKIFLNFSNALLFFGFCQEEKGNIFTSYKCYFLAKILSNQFLDNKFKYYLIFLNNLVNRSKEYKEIFNGLNKIGIKYLTNDINHKNTNNRNNSNTNNNNNIYKIKYKKEKMKKILSLKTNKKHIEEYYFSQKISKINQGHFSPSIELSSKYLKVNSELLNESNNIKNSLFEKLKDKCNINKTLKNKIDIFFHKDNSQINNRLMNSTHQLKKKFLNNFIIFNPNNIIKRKIFSENITRNLSNNNAIKPNKIFNNNSISSIISNTTNIDITNTLKMINSYSKFNENEEEKNINKNNFNNEKTNQFSTSRNEQNIEKFSYEYKKKKKFKNKSNEIIPKVNNQNNNFCIKKINLNLNVNNNLSRREIITNLLKSQFKKYSFKKNAFKLIEPFKSFSKNKINFSQTQNNSEDKKKFLSINNDYFSVRKRIKNNMTIKKKIFRLDSINYIDVNNITQNIKEYKLLNDIKLEDTSKKILKYYDLERLNSK